MPMPPSVMGFILRFDEENRAYLIRDGAMDSDAGFTDALSLRDWKIRERAIALLSFSEDTVDFLALATRGRMVATAKSQVKFSHLCDLRGLPIDTLDGRIDARLRTHFVRTRSGSGGMLPPATFRAVIQAIKAERPERAAAIEALEVLTVASPSWPTGPGAEILLQERDALGVTLDIFTGNNALREEMLGNWRPTSEEHEQGPAQAYLAGLPIRMLDEEAALQHDLMNWPDGFTEHVAGTTTFRAGERTLTVTYANRNPLEGTLGVDMIYFNHSFRQLVLVQYKMMRESGGRMIYRPDAQFRQELARMQAFHARFAPLPPIDQHGEYRLNDDGFFVKMVPCRSQPPQGGELVKGMYLTREYVEFLLGPAGPRGPNGGSRISFEDSPRHLTNTQFVDQVKGGWLGLRGAKAGEVMNLLNDRLDAGSAVLFAQESGATGDVHRGRRGAR